VLPQMPGDGRIILARLPIPDVCGNGAQMTSLARYLE
jgi:hypothetical protein